MVFSSGLLSTSLNGQTTSDCSGAVVLCGDLYQEVNASLNTGDFYEFTGGCNANLEQSSVWYTFTVQADGLLSFVLDPLNPIDDYDWGLFNITAGGCDGIGSQLLSPEMGCNSYGVAAPEPNGATGSIDGERRDWQLKWSGEFKRSCFQCRLAGFGWRAIRSCCDELDQQFGGVYH